MRTNHQNECDKSTLGQSSPTDFIFCDRVSVFISKFQLHFEAKYLVNKLYPHITIN